MVGGAPVTAAYADEIGAGGYGATTRPAPPATRSSGMAVERAKELAG